MKGFLFKEHDYIYYDTYMSSREKENEYNASKNFLANDFIINESKNVYLTVKKTKKQINKKMFEKNILIFGVCSKDVLEEIKEKIKNEKKKTFYLISYDIQDNLKYIVITSMIEDNANYTLTYIPTNIIHQAKNNSNIEFEILMEDSYKDIHGNVYFELQNYNLYTYDFLDVLNGIYITKIYFDKNTNDRNFNKKLQTELKENKKLQDKLNSIS